MENIEKEKKRRLETRDLITIGIFSAVYVIITLFLGGTMYLFGPFFSLLGWGILSIVLGTVVILLVLKVQKFGAFLILAIIYGLLVLFMGYWYNLLIYVVFALGSELIVYKGQYKKKKNIALAYCIFQCGMVVAGYFVTYLFREISIQMLLDTGFALTLQEAQEYVMMITTLEALILVIISNIIGQVLGAYIGIKINKKHFKKAGMI